MIGQQGVWVGTRKHGSDPDIKLRFVQQEELAKCHPFFSYRLCVGQAGSSSDVIRLISNRARLSVIMQCFKLFHVSFYFSFNSKNVKKKYYLMLLMSIYL